MPAAPSSFPAADPRRSPAEASAPAAPSLASARPRAAAAAPCSMPGAATAAVSLKNATIFGPTLMLTFAPIAL